MKPAATEQNETRYGWIVSLAFWLSLLLAAFCFAAVVLAPKLLAYTNLSREYDTNQMHLVALERQVDDLKRVQGALKEDPKFAAELARIDFDAADAGDERIAVEPDLRLETATAPPLSRVPEQPPLWYAPLLEKLAGDRVVRLTLITVAAVVMLTAFTFLHESGTGPIRTVAGGVIGGFRRLRIRYSKPPDQA